MIEWAINVWPYVNGKALSSGLKLKEMEASDMLDVIHYFMEEDWVPTGEGVAEARSGLRVSIYKDMYGKDYPYKIKKNNSANGRSASGSAGDFPTPPVMDLDDLANEKPFNPRAEPPKPFKPASTFDPTAPMPFEGLDGPMGG